MTSTKQLQEEYVELYNKYMLLPDNSKELKHLRKLLIDYEETLTRKFLLESGYNLEKSGEFYIYVKKEGSN